MDAVRRDDKGKEGRQEEDKNKGANGTVMGGKGNCEMLRTWMAK